MVRHVRFANVSVSRSLTMRVVVLPTLVIPWLTVQERRLQLPLDLISGLLTSRGRDSRHVG